MVVTGLNPEKSLETQDQRDSLKELLGSASDQERAAKLRQLTEWLLYEMS